MTIFYAYSFSGFIYVSSFTVSGIPNWVFWLVGFILLDGMLPSAPVFGIILLTVFWMLTCMIDMGALSVLTDGDAPSLAPQTPFHTVAVISVNLVHLMFSVGYFLQKGVLHTGGWASGILGLFILGQIARLLWYLMGLVASFLTKWLGKSISSLCGTVAYLTGVYFYLTLLFAKFDFSALVFGLSQVIGGGVRCVF